MKIEKASWQTDDSMVRITMPFAKVDEEARLVSGFATLDNVDSHADVVLADASKKAFERFRGNIREMHQPIAAGRLVSFKEEEFFDQETERFYRGIFATAYVSKGAQSTWDKVLDGTLSGFSIGGNILDADSEWVVEAGQTVRIIKDYELVELSLVDSPANQLANIFSIQKGENGPVFKGMLSETTIFNLFWCSNDHIAKTSTDEQASCSVCAGQMEFAGWFEENEDKDQKVRELITKHTDNNDAKGGAQMDENETVVETPADEVVEETAKAADAQEDVVVEPDFVKMAEDLKTAIAQGLEASREVTTKELSEIKATVDQINKSFDEKISELAAKHGELSQKFDGLKGQHDEVAKRLDGVESQTAIKKSGDVGASKEEVKKTSRWGGHFLSVSDIK